jgi:hypothetical protein
MSVCYIIYNCAVIITRAFPVGEQELELLVGSLYHLGTLSASRLPYTNDDHCLSVLSHGKPGGL